MRAGLQVTGLHSIASGRYRATEFIYADTGDVTDWDDATPDP